ncbi:MAG TPA: hypothetical protein VKE22_03525 [Haliangiales bacterium]|nr:hypothetical protein [Haliangiales bacterium]
MQRLLADVGTIVQLARRSLVGGTVHGYWRDVDTNCESDGAAGLMVRGVAGAVYATLFPIVPLLAARRRRLVGRALEAVVRAIVAGVEVPIAVNRAVGWLARKGLDSVEARADLERLLAGFLSSRTTSTAADDTGSDLKSAG